MTSKYQIAAESVGFLFGEPRIISCARAHYLQGAFTCICGKEEYYSIGFSPNDIAIPDPAKFLYKMGSFSFDHLVKDGYAEVDARRISQKFQEALDKL